MPTSSQASEQEKDLPAEEKNTPQIDSNQASVYKKRVPEKDLFVWKEAARPFKKRDKEFWVTVLAMAGIAGAIMYFVEGVMPVILIISIIFLYYVLSTVEPEKIEYKITDKGLKMADKRTEWKNIVRFWFGKRFENSVLILDTDTIPGRLEYIINENDKVKIKKILLTYLNEEQGIPSRTDKFIEWFSSKLPGNR